MKSIYLLFFLIIVSYSQTPDAVLTDQNFIEPIAVSSQTQNLVEKSISNHQEVQPQIKSQTLPQNQNNQKQNEGIPLTQQNIKNIDGQKNSIKMTEQKKEQQQININSDQKMKQMARQAREQLERDRITRDQQQDEQLRNIQLDQQLSKTQKKKNEQRIIFRKKARLVQKGTRFSEYVFEQGMSSSQFFIKLSVTQQVAINIYTYVAQDNTYVRTKNIEEEEPVKVHIYEEEHKIIHQAEFYYQHYIIFQGQAGVTYTIKVMNNGRTKLISMNCKKVVEESHLKETLQKHDGEHVQRTQNLVIEISRWHQQFRKIAMLDFQDLKSVEGFIEKYYSWELIETLIVIVICGLQVHFIQSMFRSNSIV